MTAKRPLLLKIVLVCLMLAGYVFFTYSSIGGAQAAALGSGAIVLCATLAWPERWMEYLGLKGFGKTVWLALVLFLGTGGAAFFLMRFISESGGVGFGFDPAGLAPALAQIPFQSLNEEFVLGALLLLAVKRRFPRLPLPAVSAAAALAFSLLHLAFYAVVAEWNRGPLAAITLANLFLAGVIRNNFILYLDNVSAAWAVHCGWNLVFLGPFVLSPLNEPARFNLYLGSPLTLGFFAALLAASALFLFLRRRRAREREEKLRIGRG
jgi:hypothetical protein